MLSLQLEDHLSPDDAARLMALARTQLLDSPPEERFDRLTALAAQMLGVPVALVTLVDAKRAFFKSTFGLDDRLHGAREVPLSHSLCRHVVARRSSLVVEDARVDPELRDNGAVRELGAVAYAGIPIVDRDGQTLGALCVMDDERREWTDREIATMRMLADWVSAEIGKNGADGASAAERLEWAERAEARHSEAMARVVSVIAHDFNNILTCVAGYADLLLSDESLEQTVREDIGEIARASERGAIFTRQLATLARRPKPAIAPFSVNELLQQIARTLGDSPDVTFDLQLGASLPHALADRAQLEEVLGHLISNARIAMPQGGVITLVTSLASDARGQPLVCIAVRDAGVGMDAETLERIFDPFFTTRKLTGGRGLGLTSVRNLLTEVKGRVEVESGPGAGSTFRLLLRAAD
jgi:signal transduction histidine kinase